MPGLDAEHPSLRLSLLALRCFLTSTTILPLDNGEVDHSSADKNKQYSSQHCKGLAEQRSLESWQGDQKFRVPSPLRPHTTIAIEKLKVAARDAQARVNNMHMTAGLKRSYLVSWSFRQ